MKSERDESLSTEGLQDSFDADALVSSCDLGVHKYLDLCPFPSSALSVSVSGIGSVSDYVALAFITWEYGPQPYPIKQLVAYQQVFDIAPRETKTAELSLTLGSLARYDEMGNQVLYPGTHAIEIDVESQEGMTWNFTVTGDEGGRVLEEWPQPPGRPSMKRRDDGWWGGGSRL